MVLLHNKIAWVTGGGSGIGKAIARRFLSEGARVMIVDRDEKKLQEVVRKLGKLGKVKAFRADVSKEREVAVALVQTKKASP